MAGWIGTTESADWSNGLNAADGAAGTVVVLASASLNALLATMTQMQEYSLREVSNLVAWVERAGGVLLIRWIKHLLNVSEGVEVYGEPTYRGSPATTTAAQQSAISAWAAARPL